MVFSSYTQEEREMSSDGGDDGSLLRRRRRRREKSKKRRRRGSRQGLLEKTKKKKTKCATCKETWKLRGRQGNMTLTLETRPSVHPSVRPSVRRALCGTYLLRLAAGPPSSPSSTLSFFYFSFTSF
jgi:hypothetical protein